MAVDIKETLLSTSGVYLFGRLVSDLVLKRVDPDDDERPPRGGANNFLRNQLRSNDAALARIFSFSFEGQFYELARPTIFLVHGGGLQVDAPRPADPNFDRLSRSPGRVTRTGLGWQLGAFALDLRVWIYDKGDFSMRLDVETGTLEDILLSAEADPAWAGRSQGKSSGGKSSNATGRFGGVMGKSSGWTRRTGDLD